MSETRVFERKLKVGERIIVNPDGSEERLFRFGHPHDRMCPGCNGDCGATALVNLAYVFTNCDCRNVEYKHLYEQLWHLACLKESPVRLSERR